MSTKPGTNKVPNGGITVLKVLISALLLFSVSCSPSAEDLVSDLLDDFELEEGYECALGDASLPSGTYPEELITPEGYKWECTGGGAGSLDVDSDGTFSVTLNSTSYSANQDYFSECPGSVSQEETGEWVVDANDHLCVRFDNVQPGYYNCQEITYGPGTLRSSSCVDYYEDGDYLGFQCNRYSRLGTCTLEEE